MKVKTAAAAAALCGIGIIAVYSQKAIRTDADDFPERDVIDRVFRLSPGAMVEISTIFGPVDIETTDGDTAEVHVVRYAQRREDLYSRPVYVDATAGKLTIRGKSDADQGPAKVRHSVTLRLPRRISLAVDHVNARVNIGDIDGPVSLQQINGAVRLGRSVGSVEAWKINGSLTAAVTRLSERGLRIENINGAVDITFDELPNADLSVTDFNGSVTTRLSQLTVFEKQSNRSFLGRVGLGGSPIVVSDINGGVRLSSLSN